MRARPAILSVAPLCLGAALAFGQSGDGTKPGESRSPSLPWTQTGGPREGAVGDIAIDPRHPGTIYATGRGGVFRSRNHGADWEALGPQDGEGVLATALRFHPEATHVLYLLWQERPVIHKSTDGGKSWTVLPPGPEGAGAPRELAIAPDDPKVLFLATEAGTVLKSTNGGTSWSLPARGLPPGGHGFSHRTLQVPSAREAWVAFEREGRALGLFHTVDGGGRWDEVDFALPEDTVIGNLFVDPDDSAVVYLSLRDVRNMGRPLEGRTGLFYRSADRGKNWRPVRVPGAAGAFAHLLGKAADGTLYLSCGPICKSTDEGKTWTTLEQTRPFGPLDVVKMAFDPVSPRMLHVSLGSQGIGRSRDGGETWERVSPRMGNTTVSLLAADPRDPRTLYASSDGGEGLFKTEDRGATWRRLDTRGAIDHSWGDEICISPSDPGCVRFVTDTSVLIRSEDGGVTWRNETPDFVGFRYSSIYALALEPWNDDRVYAANNGFGIFRSDDAGESWNFLRHSVDYTYAIAVDPERPGVVLSGHNKKPFERGARLTRSADRGETWKTVLEVEGSQAFTAIARDPGDPRILYAAATGPEGRGGALYVSADRGEQWNRLHPHLTFTSVHALAADPRHPERAYAGVWDGGVHRTVNGGGSWELLRKAPLSVRQLLVRNVVFAADRLSPCVWSSSDGGDTWSLWFDAGNEYSSIGAICGDPADETALYVSGCKRVGVGGTLFRVTAGKAETLAAELPRAIAAMIADGREPRTLHAALQGGGMGTSRDEGRTWLPASDLPEVRVCDLAADPDDPSRLYAATIGHAFDEREAAEEVRNRMGRSGVYGSTDGGRTWRYLGGGRFRDVRTKAVRAERGTVFAATEEGVFASRDGGRTWQDWTGTLGFADTGALARAGDLLFVGSRGGGVFTTRTDRTPAWSTSGPVAKVMNVQAKVDPRNSDLLYASSVPGGFFVSRDRGRSWHERNSVSTSFDDLVGRAPRPAEGLSPVTSERDPDIQRSYPFDVCPTNSDYLVLATYEAGLFVSLDGANTWTPVASLQRERANLRIADVRFDRKNPRIVYVAGDQGLLVSRDCGVTWTSRNEGLPALDLYCLVQGETTGRIYAGTRGYGVCVYSTGEKRWRQVRDCGNWGVIWPMWGGRPLYQYTTLLVHPHDPSTLLAGTFPAGVFKSADGGGTWVEKNVGWTNDGVFCLVFSPRNTDVIFAGTYNGINLTRDGAEHWQTSDAGWPPEQWVFSIDFDPRDPNVMYACSKNGANRGEGHPGDHGTVMKSVDGGAAWCEITRGLDRNDEFYKIIVDRFDGSRIYLATQRGGVFRSTDAGRSWRPWNRGLTNLRAGVNGNNVTNTMVLSADGRTLYFGTAGSGVFRTALPED